MLVLSCRGSYFVGGQFENKVDKLINGNCNATFILVKKVYINNLCRIWYWMQFKNDTVDNFAHDLVVLDLSIGLFIIKHQDSNVLTILQFTMEAYRWTRHTFLNKNEYVSGCKAVIFTASSNVELMHLSMFSTGGGGGEVAWIHWGLDSQISRYLSGI